MCGVTLDSSQAHGKWQLSVEEGNCPSGVATAKSYSFSLATATLQWT
jgi:hypothetical protein